MRAAVQLAGAVIAIGAGGAARAEDDDPRLVELEARVAALRAGGGNHEQQCAALVTAARRQAVDAPHVAAVVLRYVVARCPQPTQAVVLLDAARIAAASGDTPEALRHFAAAAAAAERTVELVPAVESFAALAAAEEMADATAVAALPLERYRQRVGSAGALDPAGYETLYRLGHALVRSRDPAAPAQAETILALIPDPAPAARRALYLRGVLRLQRGDVAGARPLFDRAAQLPGLAQHAPELAARDAEVRELAWLAVGRLAFEAGDPEPGYFAYQQILVHSPAFAAAFLELGWLAMESGREDLALLAFEPLIALDPRGEVGRRAGLLKGYVMLQRKAYDQARAHYEELSTRYQLALTSFDRAIGAVTELADLARDCATRDRAIADPVLEPLMSRPEVEGARRLDRAVDQSARRARALAEQLAAADGLLAGRGADNPLLVLAERQRRAIAALQEVQSLAIDRRRLAVRRTWSAGPAADDCCSEPSERLVRLRGQLEALLLHLEEEERQLREGLGAVRADLEQASAAEKSSYAQLVPRVQEEQRALLRRAIAAARRELRHTAMEGDAGVLEAIWRYKEDHREQIRTLEIERKDRLAALADQFDGAVAELESPDAGPF